MVAQKKPENNAIKAKDDYRDADYELAKKMQNEVFDLQKKELENDQALAL